MAVGSAAGGEDDEEEKSESKSDEGAARGQTVVVADYDESDSNDE